MIASTSGATEGAGNTATAAPTTRAAVATLSVMRESSTAIYGAMSLTSAPIYALKAFSSIKTPPIVARPQQFESATGHVRRDGTFLMRANGDVASLDVLPTNGRSQQHAAPREGFIEVVTDSYANRADCSPTRTAFTPPAREDGPVDRSSRPRTL